MCNINVPEKRFSLNQITTAMQIVKEKEKIAERIQEILL